MIRRTLTTFLLGTLSLSLSLAATACLDDTPVGPNSNGLRLSLAAGIEDEQGQTEEYRVAIRVFYRRTNQQEVTLPSSPDEVRVPPGTTTSRDISVQISACLADALRTRAQEGGCLLTVQLSLLDESGEPLSTDAHEILVDENTGVVVPPPFVLSGSHRILVIDDSNFFDNRAMTSAGNLQLARNLVAFTTSLPRGTANVLQLDCGRPGLGVGDNSDYCTFDLSTFRNTITTAGFVVRQTASSSGTLTSVPSDVKVLMLVTPCQDFATSEVSAIKEFVAEGGRAVLVGEWTEFLGGCRGVENQLLQNLGSGLVSIDAALECDGQVSSITAAAIRPHQITSQISALTSFCSAELVTGEGDDGIIYDRTNTKVLAAMTTISTQTLPGGAAAAASPVAQQAPRHLSATRASRSGPP